VRTPWVEFPHLYASQCRAAGGASWLQVTRIGAKDDVRLMLTQEGGALWGYHADDVNLALGNLVQDVRRQIDGYRRAQH
jgi:hypothetical protein